MSTWVRACNVGDVDYEDVIGIVRDGRRLAIYRDPDGVFYCTDGLCTHEQVALEDGLVIDHVIECPKHNGQFDYRTGAALRSPACDALVTYEVRVEGEEVFVRL